MLLKQAPAFSAAVASEIAFELYGISAAATPLPSERDQNFLLQTPVGDRFVLKVANARESRAVIEAQTRAMTEVAARTGLCPSVLPARGGGSVVSYEKASAAHLVRLLTWIPGEPLGAVARHSPALLEDLGRSVARIDRALDGFDDPALHRELDWDLARGIEVARRHTPSIADAGDRDRIRAWTDDIASSLEQRLPGLRRSVIHNDANDYNAIVSIDGDVWTRRQRLAGLIDFGDLLHTCTVADLAIAIAYAVLDKREPLVAAMTVARGYHSERALDSEEIPALFDLVRLRLCVSAALAAYHQPQRPGDEYLGISQGPIARTLPILMAIPRGLAEAAFRHACGLEPAPAAARISAWLAAGPPPAPVIATDASTPRVLDLSVGGSLVAADPAGNAEPALTNRIARLLAESGATMGIGRYGEPRLLDPSSRNAAGVNSAGEERRAIHLGLDFFAAPGTPVYAPLAGTVYASADNAAPFDYGPVIILEHATDAREPFYTLYGHLSRESLANAPVGRRISAGQPFAAIGTADVNGGWTPHLHFQLIADLLGLGVDFPGACCDSHREIWQALSPDPGACAGVLDSTFPPEALDAVASAEIRRQWIGGNVSVAYRTPVKAVRGWMQYLFDQSGRRYVDAYNNVPHVGHCHPRVVDAVTEQMRVLNTNTRYLHDGLARFAERLSATLPDPLRVCFFVNSGSEANELALRLARAHTAARDLVVLEHAYHGNTTTLVDISPYKFSGPGGSGRPSWVHVVPLPDLYRGRYKKDEQDAAEKYAAHVSEAVGGMRTDGGRLCGFIAESCPSVGGQILLPPGYLRQVYAIVRAAGGVCIADEVQTAYGRLGTHFYGFEAHGVVPDIVVLGKPIGNGYPIGAVVTTPAIASSFDNGMEFFSTFGGSTVSCAAGLAVLDVVRDEALQAHARTVGAGLIDALESLGERHAIVGDVRGSGLFLGVELVASRDTLEPAASEASFVVNRLREEGILIGTEGPFHNVLKIRPPMVFEKSNADRLVQVLDDVLSEI